jgi:ribosomal protein S15
MACCSASYKNKENIDLTRSDAYRKNAKDCGSAEFQVALLSARVEQVSKHLTANRKDFAAKRGLIAILSQRKSLLQYLFKENR